MKTHAAPQTPMADPDEWPRRSVIPRIERGRENYALYVDSCPACGGQTLHGGGPITGKPYGGYRKAHCCGVQIKLIVESRE